MKAFFATAALAALQAGASTASAANYHHDDWNHHSNYDNNHPNWSSHSDWRNHGHVSYDDWNRGQQVDWRSHHLRAPPRGYEWRYVDGRYVMAAVATGLIASIILSSH